MLQREEGEGLGYWRVGDVRKQREISVYILLAKTWLLLSVLEVL